MKEIKHQQQPTSDTCAAACIAMLLDHPVEEIIDEFHDDYYSCRVNPSEYMLRKGVRAVPLLSTYNTPKWGKLYMTTVPSLNIPASNHYVILDFRDDTLKILDPNLGKENMRHYVPEGETEDDALAVELCGYVLDFEIVF